MLSVAVALGITSLLERRTTLRTPLFYIAVIISAWFGRLGPGLLAVALSTLAVGYYFAPGSRMPAEKHRQPTVHLSVLIVSACSPAG